MILASPGEARAIADRRVRGFVRRLERQDTRSATVMGAFVTGRLVAAGLLIESPGRLGALSVPPGDSYGLKREAIIAVIHAFQEHARRRSLTVLQTLLGPEEIEQASVWQDAGFEFLAELAYLERPSEAAPPRFTAPYGLEFVSFQPLNQELFLQTLGQTYSGSLDCPRLTGIRQVEDVLATHRATGVHDPNNWWVASIQGQPAGILLLAGVVGRQAQEVVYVGVTPEARGRSLGNALLAKAAEVCRTAGNSQLILAVDRDNEPACRLYHRWNFREVARRHAWFCTPLTASRTS